AARIDFARPRGIGGAQVLRRHQQAVGGGGREAPAHERVRADPADEPPHGTAGRVPRQARAVPETPAQTSLLADPESPPGSDANVITGLVWRFRSPHHCCSESEMRTSEPKPH